MTPYCRPFQQVPDPRPQPARAAWLCRSAPADPSLLNWGDKAWFGVAQLMGACLQPPELQGVRTQDAQQVAEYLLRQVQPGFSGEFAFVPKPFAAPFLAFLPLFLEAFLQGQPQLDWEGELFDLDPWNPIEPRGHVLGWRPGALGAWVICAEAAPGAAVLSQALMAFSNRYQVDGWVLGGDRDPLMFDASQIWLVSGPHLPDLLSPQVARNSPALGEMMILALEDEVLGWASVLAHGPTGLPSNPLAGQRLALAPGNGTDPKAFDDWVSRWGAHSVVSGLACDRQLGVGAQSPAQLFRDLLAAL